MVFIIAEIGVNWDGDYDLVKTMMEMAKRSGCDAVKFQAYNDEIIKDHPKYLRLKKSSITSSNVKKIDQIAKSVNIEWFCTPMYPEAVDFLNPYVNRFKIRQLDSKELLENKTSKLIEKIFETGKEIIISCDSSPKNSKFYNMPNTKWLYVVPKYPCDFSDINFKNLKEFDGYSNHCPDILAPLSSVILGGKIIEIHITNDKSKNYLDNSVSFNEIELKQLINLINKFKKIKK